MRTNLFFILLAVAWSMNASAQTIKTYSGGMKAPKDAYFAIGEDGNGSYQYYEKNGSRVKHGPFRFSGLKYSFKGQFANGKKCGKWYCEHTLHPTFMPKIIEIFFKDDLPNGPYKYIWTPNGLSHKSASATIKDGRLSEAFTISTSINRPDNTINYTVNCPLDSHGRANGTWIVNHTSKGQKSKVKFEFCHGMHIRTSKYSESTGETEILYSNNDYNTYNRLSKIECDTLVAGAGHCLIDGDMLYVINRIYSIKNMRDININIIDDMKECFEYIDKFNSMQVFCSWSAYKTITQVAIEEQRKLEEARKMEEEKRILKEQQEEAARRAAERKASKAANTPLLKQVADNDHKIDSIYRKNNKPFFYNISSEYVKPIIYNRYKCCCKMDSCDVASIKEVLYLQDIIMKLRYMKTKNVEKQLKGGYTGEYTTENVEKFYKNFFINEALNLAQ